MKFYKAFYGDCLGVALSRRGPGDDHILFVILAEDDGLWAPDDGLWAPVGGALGSAWLFDLWKQLVAAELWCRTYCEEEPTGGYRFPQGQYRHPIQLRGSLRFRRAERRLAEMVERMERAAGEVGP